MKRTIIIATLVALVVGYGIGVVNGSTSTTNQFNAKYPIPVEYQAPQDLLNVAKDLGLSISNLVTVRAQIGFAANSCPESSADGCYDPNTKIVKISVEAFELHDQDRILAYEYYHYQWDTKVDRAQFQPELTELYQRLENEPSFANDKALFASEGNVGSSAFYSEMFSTACTNVNDSELSPQLLKTCTADIPNRNWSREY